MNWQLQSYLSQRHGELDQVARCAHGDPGRLLGLARHGAGWILIAWCPGATRAWVHGRPLSRLGRGPLYGWAGAEPPPARYRIRWRDRRGAVHEDADPYAFPLTMCAAALDRYARGAANDAYRLFGAHADQPDGVAGLRFTLWAPRALAVTLVLAATRRLPMRPLQRSGAWQLFVPGAADGCGYQFEILSAAGRALKTDPYGRQFERRPGWQALAATQQAVWQDASWMSARRQRPPDAPTSIYELHLGSFARGARAPLNYRTLAERIVAHVAPLGFTDVELLPVTEHPHEASWGYQATGYFAPTARHGSAADFRAFVERLHAANLGVILDWVSGHFAMDAEALARFDGAPLYEPADPRRAEHRAWGTLAFDFDRPEVRSFLLSSARYWLEEFHVDGLRVDAVAAMIYLDYQRSAGEWLANADGGNENPAAIGFLRSLTAFIHREFPGVRLYAEDSSIRPGVTHELEGGLGFDYKWSLGWMHDSLGYFAVDPLFRRHHHDALTHAVDYAASERHVLPLSHDEVVHGKRSLLGRMPGDTWQRHANLRLLYAWQWTHPGAKLLFMGGEVAATREWDHRGRRAGLPLAGSAADGIARLVGDLNRLYRALPALQGDGTRADDFAWLLRADRLRSIVAYERRQGAAVVVIVMNFTPVPRLAVRLGLPMGGAWHECLNTDAAIYGGSNVGNLGRVQAERDPAMGRAWSAEISVPPLGGLILVPERHWESVGKDAHN